MTLAEPPSPFWLSFGVSIPIRLPASRTEYYNPGVRWGRGIDEGDRVSTSVVLRSPWTGYRAGREYAERRNGAVFGPGFPAGTQPWPWVEHIDDEMLIDPPLYVDHAGWNGYVPNATGRLVLYRNGVKLEDVPEHFAVVPVPPETADYRLVVDATRGAPSILSTKVSAEWTFRSGHGAAVLPLSAVHLRPPLDRTNTAPAGATLPVPFSVVRQADSGTDAVRAVTVDVSYDDGATWRRVPVQRSGSTGTAMIEHPRAAGFVSLRAASTDAAGNTVQQTIIRAYRIA